MKFNRCLKKSFLTAVSFLFFSHLFSLDIPEALQGIWEGKDRIVFFEQNQESENPEIVIILKEYYGWYYDRAVEPENYAQKEKRIRNSGTTRNSEHVILDIKPISKSQIDNAWEIYFKFSKSQNNYLPVTVIDDNMFLDFYIKDTETENGAYYRGNAVSEGLKLSPQVTKENLACYYVADNQIFSIRYWLTDMDYSDEKASLKYGEKEYFVDKHIISAGNIYSCTSGRSKNIRNVNSPVAFDMENSLFSMNESVMVLDKAPYLTKIADKNTFEDLMQMVKAANARRKPDPAPLFPPNDVNWHWDLIDLLEKDNVLIQKVRERQESFGPRGKDISVTKN